MAGKTTTVIVTVSYETNNEIVNELAKRNKAISKHEHGFVTKAQLVSEIVENYFRNRTDANEGDKVDG